MKIVANLTVKDEVDLISTNIDYHLAVGFHAIVVTDYGSTDGTVEVLQSYQGDDRVHIILGATEQAFEYWEDAALIAMKARYDPDVIAYFDADEFLYSPANSLLDSDELLLDKLDVRRFNCVSCFTDRLPPWQSMSSLNALQVVSAPPETAFGQRRDAQKVPWLYTRVQPKTLCNARNIARFAAAGHSAFDHGGNKIPGVVSRDFVFVHFPITSFERFLKKVENIRNLSAWLNDSTGEMFAYHWKRWADIVQESGRAGLYQEYLKQCNGIKKPELRQYTARAMDCLHDVTTLQ